MSDEALSLHRNAITNILMLVICVLLSQVTLLVNIIYTGDGSEVSIKAIVTTEEYAGGEVVTFKMGIPEFKERYCEHLDMYPDKKDICIIVPNLAMAEYVYKMLLLANFMLVCYLWSNIFFTAFRERVPKFFSFNYLHFLYPITYIIGSILYFTVSQSFTMESGFSFAPGFYIMIGVFLNAWLSAAFNKSKLNPGKKNEKTEPLLDNSS